MFGQAPRALAVALAAAHMTSRVELSAAGSVVWTGPASIQTQGLREALSGGAGTEVRVTVQAMSVFMPPDAPAAGYDKIRITEAIDPELVGISLVVKSRPIDTEAPYRLAIVERSS